MGLPSTRLRVRCRYFPNFVSDSHVCVTLLAVTVTCEGKERCFMSRNSALDAPSSPHQKFVPIYSVYKSFIFMTRKSLLSDVTIT